MSYIKCGFHSFTSSCNCKVCRDGVEIPNMLFTSPGFEKDLEQQIDKDIVQQDILDRLKKLEEKFENLRTNVKNCLDAKDNNFEELYKRISQLEESNKLHRC